MKIKLLLLAMVLLVTTGCVQELNKLTESLNFGPNAEQLAAMEPADMHSIYQEYDENKVVANKKYSGKWVKVQGSIGNISEIKQFGAASSFSYHLVIRGAKGVTTHCFLEPRYKNDVMQLKTGQSVAVYGEIKDITDFSDDYPDTLEQCRIIKSVAK